VGFPAPADAAIATETTAQVETALARLPEQQRAVLVMRIWNTMSYTEIAEALGVMEITARTTMHHALANTRRFLEARLKPAREG
jgi:RNA polymerase sigma-70 factor (ECF subfamily)